MILTKKFIIETLTKELETPLTSRPRLWVQGDVKNGTCRRCAVGAVMLGAIGGERYESEEEADVCLSTDAEVAAMSGAIPGYTRFGDDWRAAATSMLRWNPVQALSHFFECYWEEKVGATKYSRMLDFDPDESDNAVAREVLQETIRFVEASFPESLSVRTADDPDGDRAS